MQMLVGIMDDIQRHYVDTVAEDGRLWMEGQIAVSQFTDDGLFYRARVLNIIDADTVEVWLTLPLAVVHLGQASLSVCHLPVMYVLWLNSTSYQKTV